MGPATLYEAGQRIVYFELAERLGSDFPRVSIVRRATDRSHPSAQPAQTFHFVPLSGRAGSILLMDSNSGIHGGTVKHPRVAVAEYRKKLCCSLPDSSPSSHLHE